MKNKFLLKTQEGTLTDDDFVGDALAIGAADKKYSKADHDALMELADELKAKKEK